MQGTIDNTGGIGVANGGSLKVFYACSANLMGGIQTGNKFPAVRLGNAISISKQPQDQTSCPGGVVTLSVEVLKPSIQAPYMVGYSPVYQWYKGGQAIAGATNPNLVVEYEGVGSRSYFCRISNPCDTVDSQRATVTGYSLPYFVWNLPDETLFACVGSQSFVNSFPGQGFNTSLQWYRDQQAIPGATLSFLSLDNLEPGTHTYFCRASNPCGFTDSRKSTIVVIDPPKVVMTTSSLVVTQGDRADLCAQLRYSGEYTVQWWKNQYKVSDATNLCLSIARVQPADAGVYTAVISTSCGNVTNGLTKLIVESPCGGISGYVWNDVNTNGVRDSSLTGDRPNVLFVLDASSSTTDRFLGSSVGDANGDGLEDTIMDAEIVAFQRLNRLLVEKGFGTSGRVGIVTFSDVGVIRDMLIRSGQQITIAPQFDEDGDGVTEVDEVLQSVRASAGTNFRDALAKASSWFQSQSISNTGTLIFLSDGQPTVGGDYSAEVSALQKQGIHLRAFGVGRNASLPALLKIDPQSQVFTNVDELFEAFSGLKSGNTSTEPPLPGVVVYLDINNNGELDELEPWTKSDSMGFYHFDCLTLGEVQVRQEVQNGYVETSPGQQGDHLVYLDGANPSAVVNFGDKATHRFTVPKIQGNAWETTFGADLGERWVIKSGSVLTNSSKWAVLTNIVGSNFWITVREPQRTGQSQRFFKAERSAP